MTNPIDGNGNSEQPKENEMNDMSEDLELLDQYLANELTPGEKARFEERLRIDTAFHDFAMPFIDGVNAWRDPMRMPIDARDAAENGPSHEELLAANAGEELHPMLNKFADKVGLPHDWWTADRAEEAGALFERRMRMRLVKDGRKDLPREQRNEAENEDEQAAKILYFPKWRRLLVGGGLVAAGIVGTLADLKIQAAMNQREAGKQTAADDARLHIEGRGHVTVGPSTPRSPSPILTAAGIHGTLLDGTMDISYVGSAQDSAVFATLSTPGEVSLDLDAQSRGMVIHTSVAEIELLEPGQYTIALQSDSVGYVTVGKGKGLARVDDHSLSAHGVATARGGEVIKMRKGQMPSRNFK